MENAFKHYHQQNQNRLELAFALKNSTNSTNCASGIHTISCLLDSLKVFCQITSGIIDGIDLVDQFLHSGSAHQVDHG